MKFQGALIKEQGITFGVVVVEPHVLNNRRECNEMQGFGKQAFGAIPIILMAQDLSGTPTYYGRKDIVNFLANISMDQIPWREWELN